MIILYDSWSDLSHMSQGHARVRQRKSHLCECEAGTKCMSTFVLVSV